MGGGEGITTGVWASRCATVLLVTSYFAVVDTVVDVVVDVVVVVVVVVVVSMSFTTRPTLGAYSSLGSANPAALGSSS